MSKTISACLLGALLVSAVWLNAASAQSLKSMNLAHELGSVLAAEEACGLKYDQSAVAAFIEKKVPANDMGFASTLNMMTEGSKVQQADMSPSSKTAHCTQIKRVAKAYGFIKE